MEQFLQVLQEEFRNALSNTEKSTPRHYECPKAKGLAKVAIGMRRSGKTYFLFQTIRQLISQKVSIDHLLYLNFEDDRLLLLGQKKWEK